MAEKTKKYNLEWPQNSPVQLTTTLDSFMSASSTLPQAFLFMGSSHESSHSLQIVKAFADQLVDGKFSGNADAVSYDAAISEDGVAGIREVLNLASLAPVGSSRKVVLMLNMQLATSQMLNALLKTLEEPPAHVVFIMLSERAMLPTVMSRCQVFSLHGEDDKNLNATKESLELLTSNRTVGLAERMVLVNELAAMEDTDLSQLLQRWLLLQVEELKQTPSKFSAVRATSEAIISLRGNFNKKMVIQQFVTAGLN